MATKVTPRAMAFDDYLIPAVSMLVAHVYGTKIQSGDVQIVVRDRVGGGAGSVLEIVDMTAYTWSQGEEVVWEFLAACAGPVDRVSLCSLAAYADVRVKELAAVVIFDLFKLPAPLPPDPSETQALPTRSGPVRRLPEDHPLAGVVAPVQLDTLRAIKTTLARHGMRPGEVG
jgi:hypothetical protein